MESIDAFLRHKLLYEGWQVEALARLIMAALAGGLVGLEREIRGRQAGFRTHLLVCVGSALVMIVSNRVAFIDWPTEPKHVQVDPARIAYGVMTGIGFIGAGVIVHTKTGVHGLTTAAALWCVAAMGLGAGLGLYVLTLFATGLLLLALWLLDYVEDLLPKVRYRDITLRRPWEKGCVERTLERLKGLGLKVSNVGYHRTEDLSNVDIDVRVAFPHKMAMEDLERQLADDSSCELLALRQA